MAAKCCKRKAKEMKVMHSGFRGAEGSKEQGGAKVKSLEMTSPLRLVASFA